MRKLKRIKKAYEQPRAGEWVQPIRKGYRMACCDCGLVHIMDFRVYKGRPQFAVYRHNRATAAMRNQIKIPEFISATIAEELAAKFLKATGKKSVTIKSHRLTFRLPKE